MFTSYWLFEHIPELISSLFCLNMLIAFTIIFLERKNPQATLAWIMILFLVPVVGIVLYFCLSQNISRQKIFKLTSYEETALTAALKDQIKEIESGEFEFPTPAAKCWSDLIRLNQVYGNSFFTSDNKVSIITDGNHMFESLLQDIREAKSTINIQYFIIKNDRVGRKLIETLTEKAAEGLEVRLLIDALGGRQFSDHSRVIKQFKEAGGKIAYFFAPKFKFLNLRLNYRNHRKIVVIDGHIGYMGGFNIAKEYLGQKKKFGYWRDTHLRMLGSCVQDMNARFIMDWRNAAKEQIILSEAYYSNVIREGNTGVQIVTSGPDSERMQIKRAYMKMITSATKNIYIQTPYFVPDASILESLKMAAQSGVDVRLMIPCMPDHPFVYWATYAYAGELVNSGARVFIYDKGFLHAKTMVADGEAVSVGSANFDVRSFKLNFEANAFLYDAEEAYKMEAIFENDMVNSHELTKQLYKNRGVVIKFKESISRLLTDIL